MEFKGKKFIVVGAGISGIGAVRLLVNRDAIVTLYDGKLDEETIKGKLDSDLANVNISTGEFSKDLIDNNDVMVISPGVPIDKDFIIDFKNAGKEVIGEVELAYLCAKGRLIAITGTNGKTTTTALVGEILANYFKSSFVVGNIGNAYTLEADKMTDDTVTVAEISSFQMESAKEFHPVVSCVLNVTPDHLDRHKTMENYTACKMMVTKNQTEDEVCVLNYEDDILREEAKKLKCKITYFSSKSILSDGFYLDGKNIVKSVEGKSEVLLSTDDMKIVGVHNAENAMAAIAVSDAIGVPMDIIVETVKNFKAVAHRIEYVDTINDVVYYNDSKGTNPDATIKAVEAMDKPIILIAGGYDKHVSFADMAKVLVGRVKKLVLLGETKHDIEAEAKKVGVDDIVMVSSLEEAVKVSSESATAGDVVLLSPACASWDMFKSYTQRGDLFKEYVNKLK
ncbi:UDP-N-acetylmuramoyl-L-alanine--D-glutamate ligase [uncultured Eubacterium sp.]|uniref:UDP-N-acetylmuramoyl-L-alanine--D-glutamate ligase n=1 Tax=uncultured Eubacterium sp. TaxID=165185 RepID=UPI0025947019|nr:UDP-N-acetylmuramoyl-L-alanine--D-glutamate ligase [uncultured Eubacterium sp.]